MKNLITQKELLENGFEKFKYAGEYLFVGSAEIYIDRGDDDIIKFHDGQKYIRFIMSQNDITVFYKGELDMIRISGKTEFDMKIVSERADFSGNNIVEVLDEIRSNAIACCELTNQNLLNLNKTIDFRLNGLSLLLERMDEFHRTCCNETNTNLKAVKDAIGGGAASAIPKPILSINGDYPNHEVDLSEKQYLIFENRADYSDYQNFSFQVFVKTQNGVFSMYQSRFLDAVNELVPNGHELHQSLFLNGQTFIYGLIVDKDGELIKGDSLIANYSAPIVEFKNIVKHVDVTGFDNYITAELHGKIGTAVDLEVSLSAYYHYDVTLEIDGVEFDRITRLEGATTEYVTKQIRKRYVMTKDVVPIKIKLSDVAHLDNPNRLSDVGKASLSIADSLYYLSGLVVNIKHE